MKVLLVGATGATGVYALPKLLAAGHQVTALVRTPSAVKVTHPSLRLVQGDVRDATAVSEAVRGQDAVLALFGPRSLKKDDLAETFMRNLVAAMTTHGVKKLVNLSAWGASATRKYIKLFFLPIRYTILRAVFDDKERGEALLFASTIDWVNVCPGRLTEGAEKGAVKVAEDGKGVPSSISRADLATWMIAQLGSDTWVKKSPIIGA
jgi:uncharacterized protein YbjT (DUF2867 family)